MGRSTGEIDQRKAVEAIASRLGELRQALPLKLLVLLGSHASGGPSVSGQADLLVVYEGPRRDDADTLFQKALGTPGLEARLYSQGEYVRSRGDLDVLIAKGMVLYQSGTGRRRSAWKGALSWMGGSLMGVGVLMLLAIGAFYIYSYYSLSRMEQRTANGLVEASISTPGPRLEDAAPLVVGPAAALEKVKETLSLPEAAPPIVGSTVVTDVAKEAAFPAAAASSIVGPTAVSGVAKEAASTSGSVLNAMPSAIVPANRIVIPSIEVDSPIMEIGVVFEEGEWQWERPKGAVGHLQGTADPGQPSNIVMAGHISSPREGEGQVFKRLPEVQLGDAVVLYTPLRAFQYQVVAKKVVLPSEVSVLDPTPDETLTLITCVPDLIYSHRLIVTARRVLAN